MRPDDGFPRTSRGDCLRAFGSARPDGTFTRAAHILAQGADHSPGSTRKHQERVNRKSSIRAGQADRNVVKSMGWMQFVADAGRASMIRRVSLTAWGMWRWSWPTERPPGERRRAGAGRGGRGCPGLRRSAGAGSTPCGVPRWPSPESRVRRWRSRCTGFRDHRTVHVVTCATIAVCMYPRRRAARARRPVAETTLDGNPLLSACSWMSPSSSAR